MYEEGSVASHSRGRILSFSPQAPQQRRKKIACLKIPLKGLVIGALGFLSFFFRHMVRVNTRNDEYIT